MPNYCNSISSQFRKLADEFSIEYTSYIRTTTEEHRKTIEKLWVVMQSFLKSHILKNLLIFQRTLCNKSHIYSSTYKGWYCISDETFLSESQIKEIVSKDGKKTLVSAESGHSLEWTEEENYMFKLSSFKNDLLKWLRTNGTLNIILIHFASIF